jgi:hypothetical protein
MIYAIVFNQLACSLQLLRPSSSDELGVKVSKFKEGKPSENDSKERCFK